jgi:hypothetical protein
MVARPSRFCVQSVRKRRNEGATAAEAGLSRNAAATSREAGLSNACATFAVWAAVENQIVESLKAIS